MRVVPGTIARQMCVFTFVGLLEVFALETDASVSSALVPTGRTCITNGVTGITATYKTRFGLAYGFGGVVVAYSAENID